MRKYNPYRNLFYYYRGPSSKKNEQGDRQIEDNTTKALINTLENCEEGLLQHFMKQLGIKLKSFSKIFYDLQVAEESSRPDALIEVGGKKIFIESKIDCPLGEEQIIRHLKAVSKGYMVCITPRDSDGIIVDRLNDKRVRFITWKTVYICFREYLKKAKDNKTIFVVNEFVNYLEAINMATFYGWQKSHFEAFLNIEDDPKKELRLRVKENMSNYLAELKGLLKKRKLFAGLETDTGNVHQNSRSCWGVLCTTPLTNKVSVPHFSFVVNADEFVVCVQIEGQKPANDFKKKFQWDKDALLSILRHLEGFDFTILKRINPNNRPRNYIGIPVAKIALGNNISQDDIEFLGKKMEQYRLFEIRCSKSFKRDDVSLGDASFLAHSANMMKEMELYYRFCIGKA